MEPIDWTAQIDAITKAFIDDFGTFTKDQLNWKPNEITWSIAQNIDHLILVNESYFPIINAVKNGTYKIPFIGKFPFIVNFTGKTLLNSVQPDGRKKTRTFTIWEPQKSEFESGILSRFEKHQIELKKLIADCTTHLENETVISSPANKNIVYRLDKAFDIIVAHEQRHLRQAEDLIPLMKRKFN